MEWNLFISGSNGKDEFVSWLRNELLKYDVFSWVDFIEISWGDNIREKVDEGYSKSRFIGLILNDTTKSLIKWNPIESDKETVLLVREASMLRNSVDNFLYFDFTEESKFDNSIKLLARIIKPKLDKDFIKFDIGAGTIDTTMIKFKSDYKGKEFEEKIKREMKSISKRYADNGKEVKDKMIKLFRVNKYQDVIFLLKESFINNQSNYHDDVLLLESQLNDIERNWNINIISNEEYRLSKNKLSNSILEYIRKI